MGSHRLPGKVMLPIGDKTMLAQVIQRVRSSQLVDQTVVAASNRPEDEPIWQWCSDHHIPFVIGDANDVLSRYELAANNFGASRIVRVTSDCPLIDPTVIDETIQVLADNEHLDYACNFYPTRTFPRGLDTEVFTRHCLERLSREATSPEYREHVTLMIYKNPDRFHIGSHLAGTSYADLRWTVDTPEDLDLVRSIYQYFSSGEFRWQDVVRAYFENPQWRLCNQLIQQKAA